MSTPAKAMVTVVEGIGINVGPGGPTLIDMTVQAIVVGDDARVFDLAVHAIIDPANIAGMSTAIHDAVVAEALTLGYVIAANRMLLPTFTRL